MKKITFILVMLFVLIPASTARAAEVLYEHKDWQSLARGVGYELNRRMTDAGMLDVHVLFISLEDPYITVEPVASQKELGLKETARAMLSQSGAIAGTNGDFFGMAGSYSAPFGPVAAQGGFRGASQSVNALANEFAAFFLDDENNPLLRYVNTKIQFITSHMQTVDVNTYNKAGLELYGLAIVDRYAMDDTAALDKRFPNLAKVVVSGGVITQYTGQGETVQVPEDGFVVIIPPAEYDTYRYRFGVGEPAEMRVTNNLNIDYNALKSSIGGGGLILANGQVVHDGGVAIAGRQPRTALGITQDKKMLILMTVDGRSYSIGATHDEMAELMLTYDAYDAMHLDGGGSSTMVVREPGSARYTVANHVSDGAERRVINALGVFDRSPVGAMRDLSVNLSQTHTFVGGPVEVFVYGEDTYRHRLELPGGGSTLYGQDDGAAGIWRENFYIPQRTGEHFIRAEYGDYAQTQTLYAHELAELRCDTSSIATLEGLKTNLSFTGMATDGTEAPADNAVKVTVMPAQLGWFENGVFTAGVAGAGYLSCEVNGVFTYVPVAVGGYGRPMDLFGTGVPVSFVGYPAEQVSGSVTREQLDGRDVTRMDYSFAQNYETQAAYISLDTAAVLPGEPVALRMNVRGDGSGNWLRGRVTDAEGKQFAIDFSLSVDFTDWRTVTAPLPAEAVGPLLLDRIYMAALTNEDERMHSLYFDNLEALYSPTETVDIPEGQRYTDPMRANLSDLAALGSEASVYDVTLSIEAYEAQKTDDIAVLKMTAKDGGLYAADASQWARFSQDINNMQPRFVVVLLDESPDDFARPQEAGLLHLALMEQRLFGRAVFVVSATGAETVCSVKDGIRYINLAKPETGAAAIRFSVEGREIRYDAGT